jgi:hypothetical protein
MKFSENDLHLFNKANNNIFIIEKIQHKNTKKYGFNIQISPHKRIHIYINEEDILYKIKHMSGRGTFDWDINTDKPNPIFYTNPNDKSADIFLNKMKILQTFLRTYIN